MDRKQFTFYVSFYDAVVQFKRSIDREKILMAIIEYALFEKKPEKLSESCNAVFLTIKPVLDKARKRAEAGRSGGSSDCKQTEANRKQTEANRKLVRGGEREGEREGDRGREGLEQTGITDLLKELWKAYPGTRRDPFAELCKTAAELGLTGNDIYSAISNLVVWKKSIDWTKDNGQYIPGLIKWIESGKWVSPPPPAQLTSNPFLAMAMEEGIYE